MTDEEIIMLFFQRDTSAIEQTQLKYGAYCRKVTAQILAKNEDREECMNDALLRVWNAIPPQKPRNFKLYLATIVRNVSFNRYQKLLKKNRTEVELVLEELSECIDMKQTTEDSLNEKELLEEINLFLGGLRIQDRKVFLRRYFFSESISDIAIRYGLREGSVRVILSRTRAKLKQHLMQGGFLA